jgi:hypothetical protein
MAGKYSEADANPRPRARSPGADSGQVARELLGPFPCSVDCDTTRPRYLLLVHRSEGDIDWLTIESAHEIAEIARTVFEVFGDQLNGPETLEEAEADLRRYVACGIRYSSAKPRIRGVAVATGHLPKIRFLAEDFSCSESKIRALLSSIRC